MRWVTAEAKAKKIGWVAWFAWHPVVVGDFWYWLVWLDRSPTGCPGNYNYRVG